jgi:hypothetical protein
MLCERVRRARLAPNISPKILWKHSAVGRAAAAARRTNSVSGRQCRDASPCRSSHPRHALRRRRRPSNSSVWTEIDQTLEDARRWSTASESSEAEPRTRTAARPLASAAMRSRPSRPPPPPGRRSQAFLSIQGRRSTLGSRWVNRGSPSRSVCSTQPAASHHSPRVSNCLTVVAQRHGVAAQHLAFMGIK